MNRRELVFCLLKDVKISQNNEVGRGIGENLFGELREIAKFGVILWMFPQIKY